MPELTRDKVEELIKGLNFVIDTFATENDLAFKPGRVTFTKDTFRTKVEFALSVFEEGGTPVDPEKVNFEKKVWKYDGLEKEDFGATFVARNGLRMTISGINTRAKKFPIKAKDDSGRPWKFPVRSVLKGLGRESGALFR